MTDPRRIGVSIDVKPHAYDPAINPELFEGVLARRFVAFLIDVTILAIPVMFAAIFIFIFGVITLGIGWALYWLLSPAAAIWAICYYGYTFGSPASATIGMRGHGLEIGTWVRPALGRDRDAGHGSGDAHLVRRARLFRARGGARDRLLGHRLVPHAVHPAGRLLQPPTPAAARYAGGYHRHQQSRAGASAARAAALRARALRERAARERDLTGAAARAILSASAMRRRSRFP